MSGFCVIAGEIAITMLHLIEDSRRGTLNQPSRSALRDLSVHHPSTSRHAARWAIPAYRNDPRQPRCPCPPPPRRHAAPYRVPCRPPLQPTRHLSLAPHARHRTAPYTAPRPNWPPATPPTPPERLE